MLTCKTLKPKSLQFIFLKPRLFQPGMIIICSYNRWFFISSFYVYFLRLSISRPYLDVHTEAAGEWADPGPVQQVVEEHGRLRTQRGQEEGQQGQLARCRQRRRNIRCTLHWFGHCRCSRHLGIRMELKETRDTQ